MKLKDFDYTLPKELIAQTPLKDRTASRLLMVDKETGELEDRSFKQFIECLEPGDLLVLNDTAVMPARLIGMKEDTGAVIEVLLLHNIESNRWECLVKKAKKVQLGTTIAFGNGLLKATCVNVKEEGLRDFEMTYEGIFYEVLDQLGEMPLPPYIHEKLEDKDRYQTVYKKHIGSAAAPTAGLHFTNDYLEKLKEKGIKITYLTLHVGLGTFRPVSVTNIKEHTMHEEYYSVSEETVSLIKETQKLNNRIIAVGTTSLRTLETIALQGELKAQSGYSKLFIYPGFEFKLVDSLLTNFHLPESTLLMLVSAFSSREIIRKAYDFAISKRYRFFSFGDAMFLTTRKK